MGCGSAVASFPTDDGSPAEPSALRVARPRHCLSLLMQRSTLTATVYLAGLHLAAIFIWSAR